MPNKATPARWKPVLGDDEAAEGLAVAREVARRLRDSAHVEAAVEAARQQTGYPRSVHWRPDALWQGYAGLAVLWGAADACMPDEGWDKVGLDHLNIAVRAIEQRRHLTYGLSSGLGGVALAAWLLSRNGQRYRGLLSSLDTALVSLVTAAASRLSRERPHGVEASTFDVISGLSGVGRYLLFRSDDGPARDALGSLLEAIVYLAEDTDGVPHWHTPPALIADAATRRTYPHGNLNCGLAHGIPGPLALLSVAASRGVVVNGQDGAIRRIADWLHGRQLQDEWGTNWPSAVPLKPRPGPQTGGDANGQPSRAAWCYGSPGIARALWLAGDALGDPDHRNLAVEAMEAVYRRPLSARRIDSPTFCHGVAGLQQITLRFADESSLPVFGDAARTLHRQLIDAYEPDRALGYRNLEPGGSRVDQPGLLDGAAGVAAVLLASASSVEPTWDALFLLS